MVDNGDEPDLFFFSAIVQFEGGVGDRAPEIERDVILRFVPAVACAAPLDGVLMVSSASASFFSIATRYLSHLPPLRLRMGTRAALRSGPVSCSMFILLAPKHSGCY